MGTHLISAQNTEAALPRRPTFFAPKVSDNVDRKTSNLAYLVFSCWAERRVVVVCGKMSYFRLTILTVIQSGAASSKFSQPARACSFARASTHASTATQPVPFIDSSSDMNQTQAPPPRPPTVPFDTTFSSSISTIAYLMLPLPVRLQSLVLKNSRLSLRQVSA
jgi:hypothetical protein